MISVLIATHQRPQLLDETLNHLYKQKDVQLEVIIINDNENDSATEAVVSKYKNIKYIKNNSLDGASAKRKYAYPLATGEYIYMPDDDDYLTDEYFLCKAEAILKSDAKISFVSGNASILHDCNNSSKNWCSFEALNISGRIPAIEYIQHFQESYNKPLSTIPTLFRKNVFDRVGIENILIFTDSTQYLLALLYGDAYILKEDVAVYRVKEDNSSDTYNLKYKYIINVLKQRERIYKAAKSRLPNPLLFWENQHAIIYRLLQKSKLPKNDLLKINLWSIMHTHGSCKILKKSIKNIIKIIIGRA